MRTIKMTRNNTYISTLASTITKNRTSFQILSRKINFHPSSSSPTSKSKSPKDNPHQFRILVLSPQIPLIIHLWQIKPKLTKIRAKKEIWSIVVSRSVPTKMAKFWFSPRKNIWFIKRLTPTPTWSR